MKNILKLSLVSLCACGAVFSTTQLAQANDESASKNNSDKQLVITEPAGADASASVAASSSQSSSTTYQSGTTWQTYGPMRGQMIYEPAGAAIGAPRMVTGRDQDCYANCILHQYQQGKGSARATDDHYWNNVQGDRMYAQYPAGGAMYQNFAYTGYSSPSSATWSSSSTTWSGGQQSGLWYGPDGKVYNSATSMTPMSQSSSGSFTEPAGGQSSGGQSYGAQSSGAQSSSSSAQPSATQPAT
ncbi:MAG: hypothetical protein ACXWC8_17350, partial [Limisphaerales bacterium]